MLDIKVTLVLAICELDVTVRSQWDRVDGGFGVVRGWVNTVKGERAY
jgi:hypothetical protein